MENEDQRIAELTRRVYALERENEIITKVINQNPVLRQQYLSEVNRQKRQTNVQPNLQQNIQIDVQQNLQQNIQIDVQPNLQQNIQIDVQPNLQSNIQANEQPSIQANIQANMQPNIQSSSQFYAQPYQEFSVQPNIPGGNNTYSNPDNKNTNVQQRSNVESKIGKNIMAIAASILIFISFIFFGGIVFQYITDEIKLTIMYMISLLICGVGLIKMKKDSEYYALFSSIAGCGTGAFYLVTMIGFFGFRLYNSLVLMMIIAVWLVAMIVLSKLKNILFSYICDAGLIISTFLAAVEWSAFPLGLVLYIVVIGVLYLINKTASLKKDYIFIIQIPVMFYFLSSIYDNGVIYLILGIIGIAIINCLEYLYDFDNEENKTNSELFSIAIIVFNIASLLMITTSVVTYGLNAVLVYSLYFIILILSHVNCYIMFFNVYKTGYYLSYFISIVVGLFCYIVIESKIFERPYLIPFVLLVLGYSYYVRGRVQRITAYAILVLASIIYMVSCSYITIIGYVLLAIGIFIKIVYKYNKIDKYGLTLATLFIVILLDKLDPMPDGIVFMLLSIISLVMNTSIYRKSKERILEQSSCVIGYIFNGIMMYIAVITIAMYDVNYELWFFLLSVVAIYCVNINNLLKSERIPNIAACVYTGIKLTFLLNMVLYKLDAVSVLISILCLILAIVFIVVGFVIKQKAFRMYGLVLTLISIAKLLLIDIDYDNSVMRAASFMIAGILCFGISYIYSRLEKSVFH